MRSNEFITESKVENIVQTLWNDIKREVHQRFNNGQATCTFATNVLGLELTRHGIPFRVHSGDFNGAGHWWITIADKIYDLGNNTTEAAIETGTITPVIGIVDSGYVSEDEMSFAEFARHYEKIKGM